MSEVTNSTLLHLSRSARRYRKTQINGRAILTVGLLQSVGFAGTPEEIAIIEQAFISLGYTHES